MTEPHRDEDERDDEQLERDRKAAEGLASRSPGAWSWEDRRDLERRLLPRGLADLERTRKLPTRRPPEPKP